MFITKLPQFQVSYLKNHSHYGTWFVGLLGEFCKEIFKAINLTPEKEKIFHTF